MPCGTLARMATSRRIFITGATGGVGELVVKALAARGDAVLAHARDRAALERLVSEVRASGGDVTPLHADLSSLAETRKLADEAQATGDIDALVNNAAVGFGRDKTHRETTRDGLEMRFGVNYLVPFLLTERLSAHPGKTPAVVHVASIGQAPLDESDLQSERAYEGILVYRRSKLALIMDTFERARRDPTRAYLAVHPGTLLATKMVLEAGIAPLGKAEDGGKAVVAAIDHALAGQTNVYYDTTRLARANPAAYDVAAQERLRAVALGMLAPYL